MVFFTRLYSAVILSFLVAGSVVSRTALQHGRGSYLAGRIVGRVEMIFSDLSLSLEKKQALLKVELVHAEQLKLTDVAARIRAFLGLATVQVRSMQAYAAVTPRKKQSASPAIASLNEADAQAGAQSNDEEEPFITATLSGEAQDQKESAESVLSAEDISAFGAATIEKAAAYSDRIVIGGVPLVSQHRTATLALALRRIRSDKAVFAHTQDAVTVCKKVYELLASNATLVKFVDSFKNHLKTKYAVDAEGIEGEINFKIFESMAYAAGDAQGTVSERVGSFMSSYNSYVSEENQMSADDLSFSAAEWAHAILSSQEVVKHIMFLVSFAMEQVKHDVQREPLMKQLQEGVQAQAAVAAGLLEEDEVTFSEEERQQPLVLAQYCSSQVQTLLRAEGAFSSVSQRERVEKYVNVVEQISQLTSDYDMVAREVADAAARDRLSHDISQLPEEEQKLLQKSSSLDQEVLNDLVPAFNQEPVRGYDDTQFSLSIPRKKMGVGAKIGIALTVCAVLIIGLWQAAGMMAKRFEPEKKRLEPVDEASNVFWKILGPFKTTPADLVRGGITRVRRGFSSTD